MPARSRDAWIVWFERFHRIIGIVAILIALISLFDSGLDAGDRVLSMALLGALGTWIWWCLFRRGEEPLVRPAIYLALALPLFIALGVIYPAYQILLFLAYWQMYSLLPLTGAIAVTTIFSITNIWAHQGFPGRLPLDSAEHWTFLVMSVTFGGIFAWFIGAIIRQSNDRRHLIEELQAARAGLADSEREQGRLQERQRLAGEMHDTIAQDFMSVVMALEAAKGRVTTDPDEVRRFIDVAVNAARSGLTESRRIVNAMQPELLAGTSLERALAQLAARWSREAEIPVGFHVSGDIVDIGRDADVVLFRGLQECLANIRRHAGATRVDVTLSYLGDEVILDVRDNGSGFESGYADSGGVGLATMRARVEAAGGTLSLESDPGEGATVSIALPVLVTDAGQEGRS